ncbi:hypothetical protein HZ326_18870 [Fusarium oxysporum f. sp. albedinis]|nr:hypothetical protein HZ326_18870 [Fusarium oxysporum f. sp. albedinis]
MLGTTRASGQVDRRMPSLRGCLAVDINGVMEREGNSFAFISQNNKRKFVNDGLMKGTVITSNCLSV